MLKTISFVLLATLTLAINANEPSTDSLSFEALKLKIVEINNAQNQVLKQGSSVADADNLFAMYTDDFVYIHEIYGGTYTRNKLYNNTIKFLKAGRYNFTSDRYKIVATIAGFNGIAVERKQTFEGITANHLTVFEFRGDKVSKIIEYWK
jgi:hypothetical protein